MTFMPVAVRMPFKCLCGNQMNRLKAMLDALCNHANELQKGRNPVQLRHYLSDG